jgi:hypothetical protein
MAALPAAMPIILNKERRLMGASVWSVIFVSLSPPGFTSAMQSLSRAFFVAVRVKKWRRFMSITTFDDN